MFRILLLWLALISVAFGQTLDPESIRKQLAELKKSTGVKALLATVRSGDREIVSVAMGESVPGVPARLEDHFRIGGVSETMFGTLYMRLIERGDIRAEDKLSRWLPGFLRADEVTLDMLMQNTAGYYDYVLDDEFVERIVKQPFTPVSREEILHYSVRGGHLNFEPGTQQRYSHTEFTILGEAFEKATGRTMPDLYRELVFQPAGLEHTGYSTTAGLPQPVLHAYASDRGVYEDVTYYSPSWTGESGPLYSTLGDLARWARIHGQGQLLRPESYRKMMTRPAAAKREDVYIGMGFIYENGWIAQNPSFNGYSGGYAYSPKDDLTIIVYTTQSPDPKSDKQAYQILKKLVARLAPSRPLVF